MSETFLKTKNNPNSFAKEDEIRKTLSTYTYNYDREQRETILAPKTTLPFDFGGSGGVPISFDNSEKRLFIDHTDKHTVVIGPTASKKSRLVAMPTVRILAAAKESMIVSDPKAEIYTRTATYLESQGYEVSVLNLREPQYGSSWNPLWLPYMLFLQGEIDRAYEFANDIAVNLAQTNQSNNDVFWDNSAGSFFYGLILLLFKYCQEFSEPIEAVNIGNVISLRNALCIGDSNAIRRNPLWVFAKRDSFIASTLIGTLETANDTRAGILSVFDQKMRAFAIQPSLLSMLSFNNIHYELFTQKPSAVFLILPDEKTGYHGLVSLFVKQSYEYLIYDAQKKISKNEHLGCRINYILDEFSSLPTINDFPAMITAARSRNIRFNLFLQSKHQLKLRYQEESDTIMSNCENWIFLTSRELDLLKEISELCGSISGTNQQPLLSISDLQRLDKNASEVLILSGRNKPLLTHLVDIDFFKPFDAKTNLYNKPVKREQYKLNYDKIKTNMHIFSPTSEENTNIVNGINGFMAKIDSKIKELEEQETNIPEKKGEV